MFLPHLLRAQQNKLTVDPAGQVVIQRGANAPAILKIAILPGYHVNSDKPKDEFLIPFRLTWTAGPVKPGAVSYPTPEQVQVGPDKLSVFTGNFDVTTQFSAAADAATGSAVMTGKLHYQACNDRMCFRPVTVDVRIPVLIE
ncbi:MAG TPA: protein-disulfide reductase DsbD domain-containing protein [Bryobacteraceae bacterium]|nr:protein-disulfide reductase DsbD domain-containing protein [Bryobacteraceae bacterium]